MGNISYMDRAKIAVRDYVNDNLDKSDGVLITTDQVYIVWFCKTLQNWKALASTTLLDGMYYEITADGDKRAVYIDAYKKFQNVCMPL